MLQDLRVLKAINGAVCDMGDRYDVDSPTNDRLVAIIRGIEDGKYTLSVENLKHFNLPD